MLERIIVCVLLLNATSFLATHSVRRFYGSFLNYDTFADLKDIG